MSGFAVRGAALRRLAAALALAAGLTGCGAAGHRLQLTGAQRAGARALSRSEAALDRVDSLRIVTVLHTSAAQSSRSVADISLGGRMTVALTRGNEHSQLRLLAGDAYLRANAAYWRAAGASAGAAALLVDHWFKLPDASLTNADSLLALTRSPTLGRCTLGLPGSTATIAPGGDTTIIQRASTTTDRITVHAAAPFMPISDVRSGPNIADAVCGDTNSAGQIAGGTTTFSRYGEPVHVTAPAHAQSEDEMNRLMTTIGGG